MLSEAALFDTKHFHGDNADPKTAFVCEKTCGEIKFLRNKRILAVVSFVMCCAFVGTNEKALLRKFVWQKNPKNWHAFGWGF